MNLEIMWGEDGYQIGNYGNHESACLEILKNTILDNEDIPPNFTVVDINNLNEQRINTDYLLGILYLSNNYDCPDHEYIFNLQ